MAYEDYEHPSDNVAGKLDFVVIFWDEKMDKWDTYAFAETRAGAGVWRDRANSRGCQHVRVFKLIEEQ